MNLTRAALLFAAIGTAQWALAHPGGLDKTGGHTHRGTGAYHCHSAGCQAGKVSGSVASNAQQYNRSDWAHWSDFDRDCMNTRHEILNVSSKKLPKLSPDGCYVSMGLWDDPYSGKQYTRASDLDIDHVIPLKWAHDHNGSQWSLEKKELFANDPDNLLAVDDGLNQQKSAQGPTEWLPPNHAYRCTYIAHWQRLLAKYPDLVMTSREERIFNKQVQACQ